MTHEAERAAILATARTWIGTPFHGGASIKGVGVDCAQFVRAVAIESGAREIDETGAYSDQWFMHRSGEQLINFAKRYTVEIAEADALPGDLVVYKIGRAFAHMAILTGSATIIHAHKQVGCVCEALIESSDLAGRERRYFSLWG